MRCSKSMVMFIEIYMSYVIILLHIVDFWYWGPNIFAGGPDLAHRPLFAYHSYKLWLNNCCTREGLVNGQLFNNCFYTNIIFFSSYGALPGDLQVCLFIYNSTLCMIRLKDTHTVNTQTDAHTQSVTHFPSRRLNWRLRTADFVLVPLTHLLLQRHR